MHKINHHYVLAMTLGIIAISIALAVGISVRAEETIVSPRTTQETTTRPPLSQTSLLEEADKPAETESTASSAQAPSGIQRTAEDDDKEEETERDLTPDFTFLNVSDGTAISGSFGIKGKVADADSVEFYLIPVDSNIPKYLGSARKLSIDTWGFEFKSANFPNGSFYLKAKIKNKYGTYGSGRKKVSINNQTQREEEPEDKPQAREETKDTEVRDRRDGSSNFNGSTAKSWQNHHFGSEDCQNRDTCGGSADPDKDGMNNNEEFRFGTNPKDPDTDHDGFIDGDEVKNGFNPLKASPGDKRDKMVFENPKEKGEVKKDIYKVEKVDMVKDGEGRNNFMISGRALPNTFVTIYIFSDPIILTIKTDDDGNWSYILDKDLEDGNHEVYAAVTDNTGKITGKSEPMAFVKTAQAVDVVTPAEASASERAASPTKVWSKKDPFLFAAIGLAALAIALAAIGLFKHGIKKKEEVITFN